MSDLIAQLRAALDEDERVALAAGERGRNWHTGEDHTRCVIDHDGKDPQPVVYDEGVPTEDEAAHIARWDPARVLRWVAAAREVLDRHTPNVDDPDEDAVCRGCVEWWPCRDVRVLAGVYGIGEGE